MKLNKVAFAVASTLAIAAGSAHAGQIDASSTTLAREVIYSNTQVVRAASKSYSFVGVIDARSNEQRLQLQWTLGGGLKWSRLGDVALTDNSETTLATDTQQVLKLNGKDAANADIGFGSGTSTGLVGALTGATVKAFLTNADTTLVFNITIPANAANYIKDAVFQLNANDFGVSTAKNVGVTNVLSVAKEVKCVDPDTSADISFKHFTNHSGNTTVMTGDVTTNPDSEHLRPNATNSGRFMNFTENLKFTFTNSGVSSRINAADLRKSFVGNTVTYSGLTGVPASRIHTLGTVLLKTNSNGLDLDYTTIYGGVNASLDDTTNFNTVIGTYVNTGAIDLAANGLTVKIDGNAAKGSYFALVDSTGALLKQSTAQTADATSSTITFATSTDMTALRALATGAATLVYVVDGVNPIPDNGDFAITATLAKDQSGTVTNAEQDNVCRTTMSGLGNSGIKIDVRNYASYATYGNSGPSTTLRIINNSETRTADVWAQMIYADGTYGPSGKIADLAPRAALNISNKDLEALMTTAPAATDPFGIGDKYTKTTGSTVVSGPRKASGTADRIRIVSNNGSTLRVQSYMVVGNSVIDTSNAQGVDFENNTLNRAPTTDAQPLSQDAINGLSK